MDYLVSIDPGTTQTGWAVWKREDGQWRLKAAGHGPCGDSFDADMVARDIKAHLEVAGWKYTQPVTVVREMQYASPRLAASGMATAHARGLLEGCIHCNIWPAGSAWRQYAPGAWGKVLWGGGLERGRKAAKARAKTQALAIVERDSPDLGKRRTKPNEDESDAICIGLAWLVEEASR